MPLGPPHQIRGLMLAEIDAAQRHFGRIEPGGTKPRIVRRATEGDRAGEGLHRQHREAGGFCVPMS